MRQQDVTTPSTVQLISANGKDTFEDYYNPLNRDNPGSPNVGGFTFTGYRGAAADTIPFAGSPAGYNLPVVFTWRDEINGAVRNSGTFTMPANQLDLRTTLTVVTGTIDVHLVRTGSGILVESVEHVNTAGSDFFLSGTVTSSTTVPGLPATPAWETIGQLHRGDDEGKMAFMFSDASGSLRVDSFIRGALTVRSFTATDTFNGRAIQAISSSRPLRYNPAHWSIPDGGYAQTLTRHSDATFQQVHDELFGDLGTNQNRVTDEWLGYRTAQNRAEHVLTIDDTVKTKSACSTVVALGSRSGELSSLIDLTSGTQFNVTIGGNVTINNAIPDSSEGRYFMLKIVQDTTGSRTLTTNQIKFPGGAPELSTGAGDIDVLSAVYNGGEWIGNLLKDFE